MRLLVLIVLALAALPGCGDDEPPAAQTVTVSLPSEQSTQGTVPAPTASGEVDGSGPAESATEDPRDTALEDEAAQTVREYLEALDARNGAAVCSLLAPGAIELVELPENRGSCAESLTASIGYEDPRGFPVYAGTEITGLRVTVEGDSAKVVAHVVTEFADRDEPSIEDDLVYLTLADGKWLVAKPSASLYRAVGIADLPLEVLSPPE